MPFGILLVLVLAGWMLKGLFSTNERDQERAKGAGKMLFGGLMFGFLVILFGVMSCVIMAG